MFGKNGWRLRQQWQFLPGAKVAFVFAKETWSKIQASYWMREIRLAIRLLISLNLLLVSV
jgi:hypothetical protein